MTERPPDRADPDPVRAVPLAEDLTDLGGVATTSAKVGSEWDWPDLNWRLGVPNPEGWTKLPHSPTV